MKRLLENHESVDHHLLPQTKRMRMREEHSVHPEGGSWFRGSMLGKGGFGSVYLAFNLKPTSRFEQLPSVMAVKSVASTSSFELVKEKILLQLLQDCPFVIRCYGDDFTTCNNGGDCVMNLFLEFSSEGTLVDLIGKSNGFRLVESQVRCLTHSILRGIKAIHDAGYVHCDLKPENILLFPQQTSSASGAHTPLVAKIADLGLAKSSKDMRSPVRGTLMYLSPEAVEHGVQDKPSDIWALGCTILCMLTGRNPWDSKSREELKHMIAEGVPVVDWVSKQANDFLHQCFARSPADRPTADMLLTHPFVSCPFDNGDEDELISVQPAVASSKRGDYLGDGCSFIPLLSSSFGGETEEEVEVVVSDRMRPNLPIFAVCGAA